MDGRSPGLPAVVPRLRDEGGFKERERLFTHRWCRGSVWFWLILWLGLWGWGGGWAARAAIRFDVFLGYDGILPSGSWFPVVCEVMNDGPGFDAIFEIKSSNLRGDTHRLALELPTGTLKRFVVPVHAPGSYAGNFDALLLDTRGRTRAELLGIRMRNQMAQQVPLVGAVSRTPPVLAQVSKENQGLQPVVARILPQLFPDHPLALRGMDVLYLSSERALALTERQAKALELWVQSGGHLVVGIEQVTQVQGTAWLSALMPCELTGTVNAPSHRGLQEWLISNRGSDGGPLRSMMQVRRGTPQADQARRRSRLEAANNPYARIGTDQAFEDAAMSLATCDLRGGWVLAGTREQPLVVTGERGSGRVTVLLFNPELEPFLSWEHRALFWSKLTEMPLELLKPERIQQMYYGDSVDGVFGAMVETKQVRKVPVGGLLLLLAAYLVVIGPLDHFVLKRMKRQMLTWVTFPAYVVFFSLLIYFIGYKLRAGESEWNELHLVDVVSERGEAALHGRTYGSVYSPANARYEFKGGEPYGGVRSEFGSAEGGRVGVEQRGDSFQARISVPVWTSQLLVFEWWQSGEAPLEASWEGGRVGTRLRVRNQLDTVCQELALAWADKIYRFGPIQAGEQRVLDLSQSSPVMLEDFVSQFTAPLLQAMHQRRNVFAGDERGGIANLTNAVFATTFADHAKDLRWTAGMSVDLSPVLDRGGAVLMAWAADFTPASVLHQFKPRRSRQDTVWRVLLAGDGSGPAAGESNP